MLWGLGFRDVTPITENGMAKQMRNDMETGVIKEFLGLNPKPGLVDAEKS